MALPTSGQISLGRIRAEINPAGSNSDVRIGNYNRGGTGSYVNVAFYAADGSSALPTSNTDIRLSHYLSSSMIVSANAYHSPASVERFTAESANAGIAFGETGIGSWCGGEPGGATLRYIMPADTTSTTIWDVRLFKTADQDFTAGPNNIYKRCNTGAAEYWCNVAPQGGGKQVTYTQNYKANACTVAALTYTGLVLSAYAEPDP